MDVTGDRGDERRLADIEQVLTSTDPDLAEALRTFSLPHKRVWPWHALTAVPVRRAARVATPPRVPGTDGEVVVGVDGSGTSQRAAIWAARQAAEFDRSLTLVYGLSWPACVQAHPQLRVCAEEPVRRWAHTMLDVLADRCRLVGALDVRTRIVPGDPADAVIAGAGAAAFVVVGHDHRSGVTRLIPGSTAFRLTRSCPWPVVVVRDGLAVPHRGAGGPVVVGVDGSAVSGAAVRFAFDFAARHGADVRVVHSAGRLDTGGDYVETDTEADLRQGIGAVGSELAACARKYPGVRADLRTTTGDPARVLLGAADHARLLVVGSHGKGALGRALLGSVSHTVVDRAPCPVAVLPPETLKPLR
ncbi:MAG: universal stress protein [Saccharothrix sp.]|nr:universal stress protein [Saccharothrix sp.]